MVLRMIKKAVFSLKSAIATYLPFCGPPLDCGLSLLSRQAERARNSPARRVLPDRLGARIYSVLADAGRLLGDCRMNEIAMIDGSQTEQILNDAIDQRVTAIMSYLSKGKWHVARVQITDRNDHSLIVQTTQSYRKSHPININIDQPVGISFKHEYGKYVFDSAVTDLRPAMDPEFGGTIVLTMPEKVEVIQRRSYFRVEVPESMSVKVTLWRRKGRQDEAKEPGDPRNYILGTLVDISAGGAQVILDSLPEDASPAQMHLRDGQFIGMRFTPLPYEVPLTLTAQIRNVLPRAGDDAIFLGLQLVGLEASAEGRAVLGRLVGVVERYYKMNQAADGKKKTSHALTSA